MRYPDDVVELLAPISLEELVASADLQTRRDRKYVVPIEAAAGLVSEEAQRARVLEVDRLRSFRYESVYFDTPDLRSYLGAARRRPNRFKVRTRSYLDSGESMLEIKTRDRSGRTVKHRTSHPFDARNELCDADRALILGIPAAAEAAPTLDLAMIVRYQRTTLALDDELARVTIDTELTWQSRSERSVELRHVALVETKTAGPPSTFDRSLWQRGFRPVVISKYCTGMAALLPELPANKWNRSLRRFFGWTPERQPTATGPVASSSVTSFSCRTGWDRTARSMLDAATRRLDVAEPATAVDPSGW